MKRTTSIAPLVAVSFCAWSLVSAPSGAQTQSESFDKAIKETVVDLGVPPEYAGEPTAPHIKLRCHYFQNFLVKELDSGGKGDDWISIATNDPSHLTPCAQERAEGETVIQNEEEDYFSVVKRNFVFLSAADCFDRGCPFYVFDALTKKKLFEDQLRLSPKGKIADIHFSKNGSKLVMRYPSVVAAECSLPLKKSECWKEILHTTGLTPQPMPRCVGYSGFIKQEVSGTDDQRDPSVVSFPVEVAIPEFKRRILHGPVACWAAD
jgi:hypothetical protein